MRNRGPEWRRHHSGIPVGLLKVTRPGRRVSGRYCSAYSRKKLLVMNCQSSVGVSCPTPWPTLPSSLSRSARSGSGAERRRSERPSSRVRPHLRGGGRCGPRPADRAGGDGGGTARRTARGHARRPALVRTGEAAGSGPRRPCPPGVGGRRHAGHLLCGVDPSAVATGPGTGAVARRRCDLRHRIHHRPASEPLLPVRRHGRFCGGGDGRPRAGTRPGPRNRRLGVRASGLRRLQFTA